MQELESKESLIFSEKFLTNIMVELVVSFLLPILFSEFAISSLNLLILDISVLELIRVESRLFNTENSCFSFESIKLLVFEV